MARLELTITGRVQGVGFRPALYRLAAARGLQGSIANTDAGVVVDLEGPREQLAQLAAELEQAPPPHSQVEHVSQRWLEPAGAAELTILPSVDRGSRGARIPADLATCDHCLAEVRDADDRRHGYALTNCTACGPRLTIVRAVPYDRPLTTMAAFEMCPACAAEYADPLDRRYHAEPTACPDCGPRLELVDSDGQLLQGDPVQRAAALLGQGQVVAVKGLGGFHLAADARNGPAIARLRQRKGRADKPFAVMVRDLDEARRHAEVDADAAALLRSAAAPIVLLPRAPGCQLAAEVSPGIPLLGLLLPYTPLHHLLLARIPALVMTSGNFTEEAIAISNADAARRLASLADALLQHDREILVACEDSVVRPTARGPLLIRRSRGYVPDPISLSADAGQVLALGGQLKNTFCLTNGEQAFLGPHVGDLDSPQSYDALVRAVEHMQGLLRLRPEAVVHDLHPDYATTRLAQQLGLPAMAVQHHHAHAAAVVADRGLSGAVLGLSLDGTGLGSDGTIWGGELLHLPHAGQFRRLGHLRAFGLPGGEACIRRPARAAQALTMELLGPEAGEAARRLLGLDPAESAAIAAMLRSGTATARSTSCGRLFDAVAALCGVGRQPTFEGQPAMLLEALARGRRAEPYAMELGGQPLVLDPTPTLAAVLQDLQRGVPAAEVAARFQAAVVQGMAALCASGAAQCGAQRVVLGGGCLQNQFLAEQLPLALERHGLRPYLPRRVPPNDGGLALGQAVVHALAGGD